MTNENKNPDVTPEIPVEPQTDEVAPPPPPPPPAPENAPPPPPPPPLEPAGNASAPQDYDPQKKVLAGVLGIVLGAFGVHKFILGYQKEGFIMLGVSIAGIILSCIGIGALITFGMGIVGLVEGIMYLTKSDDEFYEMYIKNQKPWF